MMYTWYIYFNLYHYNDDYQLMNQLLEAQVPKPLPLPAKPIEEEPSININNNITQNIHNNGLVATNGSIVPTNKTPSITAVKIASVTESNKLPPTPIVKQLPPPPSSDEM